jgi:hypothetical protein
MARMAALQGIGYHLFNANGSSAEISDIRRKVSRSGLRVLSEEFSGGSIKTLFRPTAAEVVVYGDSRKINTGMNGVTMWDYVRTVNVNFGLAEIFDPIAGMVARRSILVEKLDNEPEIKSHSEITSSLYKVRGSYLVIRFTGEISSSPEFFYEKIKNGKWMDELRVYNAQHSW